MASAACLIFKQFSASLLVWQSTSSLAHSLPLYHTASLVSLPVPFCLCSLPLFSTSVLYLWSRLRLRLRLSVSSYSKLGCLMNACELLKAKGMATVQISRMNQ